MTRADEEVCKEKCKELYEAGLIRRSTSEYAAATVVAARKDATGEILSRRMCGDFRDLNKITKANRYPMPTPEEIFDKLVGATVFSTLDLRQGFNQIQIREEDRAKTEFHGVDGLWEWNGMPFGMRNSSAIFQQAMDTILRGIDCAACYIDDVVIFSKDAASHVADVERVLGAIMNAGLTCHPNKCEFGEETVKYLGFEVSDGTLSIQEAKVAVLDKVAVPTDRSRLRAILGFLNYYRRFVPNFSKRASLLNQLLKESNAWKWGEQEDAALQDLLGAVKTGPVLVLPRRDQPFVLYTDWSSLGMGAVLCQETERGERVVAFASRSCSPTEANYSSYEGEGPAAVWAVDHFRVYLHGSPFTLVTDHQPLTWLMTNHTLTGRNARWAMRLQEYEFKIRHRPGKTLQHMDGLSRNPPPPEEGSPSACLVALASGLRETEETKHRGKGPEDVWEDATVLQWVKGETEAEEDVGERARARGRHYRWYQNQLQVTTKDGWKLVPAPEQRRALIEKVHGQLGHYGHVRTAQLLTTGWWWAGLQRDVKEVVADCELCSRNKANLEREQQELQSLPIRGLGYQWSLDLAGELPLSRKNKRYVLVMIEHVSKWVEVRALSSKSSELVAEAFTDQVLTRFGACGEVLTDQGTEFKGAFDQLLNRVGITHRRTSRYHPQADGLTERMVQTVKKGLRAHGEGHKRDWDQELHWVVAGYRFSKQAALRDYSPYYLLYGKELLLPVGAPKQRLLQTGKGKGKPVESGTEVYIRKTRKDTLDIGLSAERWVVKEVKPSGVLVLESEEGEQRDDHVTNVARATGSKMQGVPHDQQQEPGRSRKGASG
ncbi:unnamed protein product [Closterium sp. Naga37s-1]|nr:unnamed protein product [Closterium sp. Naga37s-1]